MSWYGKIIGGSVGALFGPGAAFAGASVGHYFDNRKSGGKKAQHSSTPEPIPMSREKRSHILFHNTFAMFAKMAAADGFVIQEEVDTIKKFMAEPLNLAATAQTKAKKVFNTSKKDNIPYAGLSEEFALAYRHDPQTLAMTFEMLLAIALSDGVLHPEQDKLLQKTLYDFKLSSEIYATIRRETLPDIDSLYNALGCSPEDSDEELKKAYRKASREFHPDRLTGKITEGVRKLAEEKFKEISSAYKTLCKLRNIK